MIVLDAFAAISGIGGFGDGTAILGSGVVAGFGCSGTVFCDATGVGAEGDGFGGAACALERQGQFDDYY